MNLQNNEEIFRQFEYIDDAAANSTEENKIPRIYASRMLKPEVCHNDQLPSIKLAKN